MLNSFKFFFRSFRRNKLFSVVNILGLTVGFFTSILIYLYVDNEMNYDSFHENGDHIYRINQTFIWGEDNPNWFSSTGPGVGYAIQQDVPEVRSIVKIHTFDPSVITFNWNGQEKFFNDETIFAADSGFFNMFSFPLLHGNPETALQEPRSIVLKYETAIRFFGTTDVLGQLVSFEEAQSYTITGVMDQVTENTYLDRFDLLISMNTIDRVKRSGWNWIWTTFETYIQVREEADVAIVREKIAALPEKHAKQSLEYMGYTWEEYVDAGKEWNLILQPFQDIRLHSSNVYNRLGGVGDNKIVIALISSAVFLLILSSINFINLSTAQFTSKAKDVALRKVLGGTRLAFIQKFFGESFAYCLISLFAAIILINYSIPWVNQSLDLSLTLSLFKSPQLILFITVLIVSISLISGFYPFLFFSAFKPISAMKGEFKTGNKGLRLRNGMLVIQYALSFILIMGTFTIYNQLNYFLNADLGFERDNLLIVENVGWIKSKKQFVDELSKIEGVQGTTLSSGSPLYVSSGDQFIPDIPDAGSIPLNFTCADENFPDVLKLEFAVGRSFDESFSSDSSAVILNETAARTIGWSIDESILNKKIENNSGTYHVVGVIKDFNFWSLHAPIEPFAIFHAKSNADYGRDLGRVLVRSKSTQEELESTIDRIESKWREFMPNRPFEHVVLNDRYAEYYSREERFGGVLSFFSVLTVIIASLGLFGIVVFSIEQKMKEIGVRKVLGASVANLIYLFSRSYVKLLLVAFAVASPFGYLFMENWLSDFEYRINIQPWIFVVTLSILLFISLAISIFHTVRAASLNPSEVLRDE